MIAVATMLVLAGLLTAFIGFFVDPDSDFRIFLFIVCIVLLAMGLFLKILECVT